LEAFRFEIIGKIKMEVLNLFANCERDQRSGPKSPNLAFSG